MTATAELTDGTPAPSEAPASLRAVHTPNFPALCGAGRLAPGHHLPGRQAGDGPRRGRPPQHPLPDVPGPDGPGPRAATAWPSARRCRSGSTSTSRPSPPSSSRRAATTPASCPAAATSPATSRSTRWPGAPASELWFVNTRFSCLCTLDRSASFVPRWRPPFVTALEPTDRCHLNGLGDGRRPPRYVTALGQTDAAGRLAAGKGPAAGSDRRRQRRGAGARACRCPTRPAGTPGGSGSASRAPARSAASTASTGEYEPIAAVPGFTRGLDFAGNLAFVGLSQVRETAVFSGIPITERLKPSQSGPAASAWST